MKSLVVSLHDVSPLTQTLCEEILAQLQQLGITQTSLLIIPNHHQRAPIYGFEVGWRARSKPGTNRSCTVTSIRGKDKKMILSGRN
jgi:hypothetical protein